MGIVLPPELCTVSASIARVVGGVQRGRLYDDAIALLEALSPHDQAASKPGQRSSEGAVAPPACGQYVPLACG
jgi:hypothetical protein